MSDLIKITQKEHDWLINLLPDDIRTMQLYRQPALNNFQIDYLHDGGTITQFIFGRGDATTNEWIKAEVPDAQYVLDTSTIVTCTGKAIFPNATRSDSIYMAFGFSVKSSPNIYIFTPNSPFWDKLKLQGVHNEYTYSIVWLYEAIQYLLLHHKELLQFSVTKDPNKHSGKKKGGKTKKSPPKKTRLYRLVHMSDDQADELKRSIAAECEKRTRERLCSAWGVRGHYRHYKSGKVAYIKPHVRGKEKEKYTGREYALFPKNIT